MYTKNYGFAKLDVIGGCSGSGLFNDNDELIGVVWGAFTEGAEGGGLFGEPIGGTKIGLFETLDDVRKFLLQVEE
jgi:S1-C subfamily serine protease